MLVYEKTVDEERHIFGTLEDIPAEGDVQLTYKDAEGAEIEDLTLDDTYLDDGHGGIIRESDKKAINVFIEDTQIVPQTSVTAEQALAEITEYQYEPPYIFKGEFTINGTTVDYTIDAVAAGQGHIMNDFARALGAIYRGTGGAASSVMYKDVKYTWNPEGTLKGSNYEDEQGTTLISVVVADMSQTISSGSATVELTILGEVTTFNATVTQ